MIEAIGIDVGYGAVSVVKELSLMVRPGEVVAMLGVNGAGRSTTVKALAGELRPTAGEIRIKGQPMAVHDLPAGGTRLIQPAVGYDATIVAGEITRLAGVDTGARPGRILRRTSAN